MPEYVSGPYHCCLSKWIGSLTFVILALVHTRNGRISNKTPEVIRLVCQLAGWQDGWLLGCLVGWFVGYSGG